MVDRGQKDLLELFVRLSQADDDQRAKILHEAFKTGYVTTSEFERFIHLMNDKVSDVKDLIQSEMKSAKMELEGSVDDKIDAKLKVDLPIAVAKVNADQRAGAMNWVKQRATLVTSVILLLTSAIGWYTALKSMSEVRDLKRIATVAEQIDDALDP